MTEEEHANRRFDKTSLKSEHHGRAVHRDYAAHFFRWGFITNNMIEKGKTKILDIGCGVDTPLAHIIWMNIKMIPRSYLGVDLNKEPPRYANRAWSDWRWNFSFPDRWKELRGKAPFDLAVCLEVVEHMRPPDVNKLLRGAHELLSSNGRFVLSTPVYNGKKMAHNHVNEMTIPQLAKILDRAGFEVVHRFGTFMSYNDAKKCASPQQRAVLDQINEYYSKDVTACFLAPLYPDHSRNNIWILRKRR